MKGWFSCMSRWVVEKTGAQVKLVREENPALSLKVAFSPSPWVDASSALIYCFYPSHTCSGKGLNSSLENRVFFLTSNLKWRLLFPEIQTKDICIIAWFFYFLMCLVTKLRSSAPRSGLQAVSAGLPSPASSRSPHDRQSHLCEIAPHHDTHISPISFSCAEDWSP